MKVFLLTTPLGRAEPVVYPLGLAYLVPHLRGHDVAGYDVNLPGRSLAEGLREAAAFGADVLAFSFRNVDTTQERDLYTYYPAFLAAMRQARAALPAARIVVGGAAFSIYGEQVMAEAREIGVGIRGEGETVLPGVLAEGGDYRKVAGVLYRDGGRVAATAPAAPVDFAAAPPPDRRVFAVRDYLGEPFAVGVQTRRGCPRACAYCTYPLLEGKHLRVRPAAAVADEVESLRRAGLDTFTFVDSLWAYPPATAKELCRELIRRELGMKWKAYFDEATFDGELADLALAAGAAEFTFSSDAAADGVLAALGKELTPKDLYRTLDILSSRPKAVVSYSFFINPPGQTCRTFGEVVKFYIRGKRLLGRRFLGAAFGNVRLELGTPAYERARAEGKPAAGANLLPRSRRELARLFYHARPALKVLSRVYAWAWRLKSAAARLAGR